MEFALLYEFRVIKLPSLALNAPTDYSPGSARGYSPQISSSLHMGPLSSYINATSQFLC